MIAEKILGNSVGLTPEGVQSLNHRTQLLAAMQTYADFYYWLATNGYEKYGDGWLSKTDDQLTEDQLYNKYLNTLR